MKKSLFLLFLCVAVVFGASNAMAYSTTPVNLYNGSTNSKINVTELDWNSSGSALAQGLGPFGSPIVQDQTFTLDYEANLTGVNNASGQPVTFNGLNSSFEYTVVAKFNEVVTGVSGTTAYFSTTGGQWAIYYDDNTTTFANIGDGTGFDDGHLVIEGSIDPNNLSTFTATGSAAGIGVDSVAGKVSYYDPTYIDNLPSIFNIFDFHEQGTINYPPASSASTAFFDNVGGDINWAKVTVGANDLQLKADTSSTFSTVPEPSTMFLLGLGLMGIAGYARKRAK